MDGKICVVTGATGGIGGAAAEALVRRGATVALLARSEARGAALHDRLAGLGPGGVRLFVGDLSRQEDVRRLAAELGQAYPRIDVLINNAGTFSWRRRRTPDGVELQWAVNHLSHYLLTRLLLGHLRRSDHARIVNVSSQSHRSGHIDPRDPTGERRRYSGLATYSATKLANLLFTHELARREGTGLTVSGMHPGVVATEILLGSFPPLRLLRGRMRTPEEGARTAVFLATDEEAATRSGEYWIDERPVEPAPAARDEFLARALWDWSETAVGGVER